MFGLSSIRILPGKEGKEVRVGNLGSHDRHSDLLRLVHVRRCSTSERTAIKWGTQVHHTISAVILESYHVCAMTLRIRFRLHVVMLLFCYR